MLLPQNSAGLVPLPNTVRYRDRLLYSTEQGHAKHETGAKCSLSDRGLQYPFATAFRAALPNILPGVVSIRINLYQYVVRIRLYV